MKKMKKFNVFLLILTFILMPTCVFASSGNSDDIPLGVAIFMEAFVSIHMSIFVLLPLSKIFSKDNSKRLFIIMFIVRVVVLLFCDFFVTPMIAMADFFAVFIGAFIVVPIATAISGKKLFEVMGSSSSKTVYVDRNGQVINNPVPPPESTSKNDTSPMLLIDPEYLNSEKILMKHIIKSEIESQGEDIKNLTTNELNSRKNITILAFGILTCLFTLMYFFNYSLKICIICEIIAIIVYKLVVSRFNVVNAISKYAKKNPNSEIFQIVSNVKDRKKYGVLPNYIKLVAVTTTAIIIPIIMFSEPKLVYSRCKGGYSVLRYTRGFTPQDEEITIPDEYKGKPVVQIGNKAFATTSVKNVNLPKNLEIIRGKAFYNCTSLENIDIPENVTIIKGEAFENCTNLSSVSLPEGLKELRGSVFRNDSNLYDIDLPDSLEYLGGGAFAHCSLIEEITIPPKVTEINGETFIYCTSLEKINLHDNITSIHGENFINDVKLDNVVLPSKITEIRGNTFENCSSLTSIVIPEGVTRIGGHAFYGCSSLSYVSVPSTVKEIGSSAFRRCTSLISIDVPSGAEINERAFKESPTDINYY